MMKHGRTSGSNSSNNNSSGGGGGGGGGGGDPYGSYKRALENDALKDNGLNNVNNSDVIRPPKTKVVKSRTDSGIVDFHHQHHHHRKVHGSSGNKYPPGQHQQVTSSTSSSTYVRLPRRSKATKKDKGGEKLSVSKLPRSDGRSPGSRPPVLLGRRSRTFIVESHQRLLDYHGVGDGAAPQSLLLHHQPPHPHPHSIPHPPRTTGDSANKDDPSSPASTTTARFQENGANGSRPDKKSPVVSSVKSTPQFPASEDAASNKSAAAPNNLKEAKSSSEGTASRWHGHSEAGSSRSRAGGETKLISNDPWEGDAADSLREGARNPLYDGNGCLPARPKSAGQLRYYDSDDSDESSLDGEIEIVDIDKELENDPEPSPYWNTNQGPPPLQVPEVFVQADTATTTTTSFTNSATTTTTTTATTNVTNNNNNNHDTSPVGSPSAAKDSTSPTTTPHNRNSRFSFQQPPPPPPLPSPPQPEPHRHQHHHHHHHRHPHPHLHHHLSTDHHHHNNHAARVSSTFSNKHEPPASSPSSSSSHSSPLSSFAQQQQQQQHQPQQHLQQYHHQYHNHNHQQQQYPVPQPPPQPQPPLRPSPRHRHDSGESSLSAFSDITATASAKPAAAAAAATDYYHQQQHQHQQLAPTNGRRRIMSEPEIIVEAAEHGVNNNSRLGLRKAARKSGQGLLLMQDEPSGYFRGGPQANDLVVVGPTSSPSSTAAATAAAAARASRERLYSDTMERVLSRYSELGLHDDVFSSSSGGGGGGGGGGSRRGGKPSRIPVGNSGATSASSRSFSSSSTITTSGHMNLPPPRKLKPILKQPRCYDTNDISE